MRILQLVHQYPPDQVGGTELYTQWLAQELCRQGHQASVFYRRYAPGSGLDHWTDETGVRVWAARSGPLNPNRRFMATFGARDVHQAFERVMDQSQAELVHVQHLMGLPLSLWHVIHERSLPVLVTLHDFWWICANAQLLTNYGRQVCPGPQAYLNCARCALARAGQPYLWPAIPPLALLLAWRGRLLRRALRSAHHLVAPSRFVRDWYAAHGAPAGRLSVIPHGLKHRPAERQRESEPATPLRLGYVGGLSWQKGVHVLIEALQRVRGQVELWIAGDGSADPDYAARLRQKASRLPPTSSIRFLGRLSREEVWEMLDQVDAVALPSIGYETFALVVSEAFASNLPLLASDLGALADRVRDGRDGLLLPPGDVDAWRAALQRLVDEPKRLDQLRRHVRPPMRLDEHVQRLSALYAQLVDEPVGA